MSQRETAVAGFFYPSDEKTLLREVDGHLGDVKLAEPARAVVLPHAGYVYSGSTVGAVLSAVEVPDRVVLIGPKHSRSGALGAVAAADAWSFPFGQVKIDHELAGLVAERCDLEMDDLAHREEHSLEVQVPFLWRRNPNVQIVPVALGLHRPQELQIIGEAIADIVSESKEPILLAASTDMSHQIPLAEAERLDHMAIEKMLAMDPEGLYDTVFGNSISMCGVIPTTAVLFAMRKLGAAKAELVKYTTSAEASGDTSRVVGYAGLVVR